MKLKLIKDCDHTGELVYRISTDDKQVICLTRSAQRLDSGRMKDESDEEFHERAITVFKDFVTKQENKKKAPTVIKEITI